MEYYRHEFDSVEDYLHHRKPYLLVDEIDSISDAEVITRRNVNEDDFFFNGHFPGAPIVPGAMLQELTTQSAGILIAARFNPMRSHNTHDPFANEFALGVLVGVKHARYRNFARPGDMLTCRVRLNARVSGVFDFTANVTMDERPVMRNEFQLTNLKSAVLQGAEPVG